MQFFDFVAVNIIILFWSNIDTRVTRSVHPQSIFSEKSFFGKKNSTNEKGLTEFKEEG